MSKETNVWKEIILESLDFIRYKIESDRLTVGEAESIAKAFMSELNLRGTANDFASFWNKPKTNVTSLIDRKVMHKPVREVLYPFFPVRDAVFGCLYDCRAPEYVLDRSSRIMESGYFNRGFTYANPETRRAVVVVGPTTSGEQFVNTVSHEIYHLAVSIGDSIGYDLDGEGPAYLVGDTMQELISVICKLGCSKCR